MEGLLNVTMERKKEGRKTMRIVGGGRVCFLGYFFFLKYGIRVLLF